MDQLEDEEKYILEEIERDVRSISPPDREIRKGRASDPSLASPLSDENIERSSPHFFVVTPSRGYLRKTDFKESRFDISLSARAESIFPTFPSVSLASRTSSQRANSFEWSRQQETASDDTTVNQQASPLSPVIPGRRKKAIYPFLLLGFLIHQRTTPFTKERIFPLVNIFDLYPSRQNYLTTSKAQNGDFLWKPPPPTTTTTTTLFNRLYHSKSKYEERDTILTPLSKFQHCSEKKVCLVKQNKLFSGKSDCLKINLNKGKKRNIQFE